MSVPAVNWAFAVKGLTAGEHLVLVRLAWYAEDGTDKWWPSVRVLAAELDLSQVTVYKALVKLEKVQLLTIQRGRGQTRNVYTLAVSGSENDTPPSSNGSVSGSESEPPAPNDTPGSGSESDTRVVQKLKQVVVHSGKDTVTKTSKTFETSSPVVPDRVEQPELATGFIETARTVDGVIAAVEERRGTLTKAQKKYIRPIIRDRLPVWGLERLVAVLAVSKNFHPNYVDSTDSDLRGNGQMSAKDRSIAVLRESISI